MLSSGGVATLEQAAEHPAAMLLSGPAGGAVAARIVAEPPALGFDMGGTSCDTFFLAEGGTESELTVQREVAGLPVRLPMVDIHTVSAGGGSIGWVDSGGALRVGPQSAGADPGPACYGRGGEQPTVTDANLILGRLPAESPIAADLKLDVDAARAALESLGIGSAEEAAEGVVAVAVNAMVQALRVVSVERGHDPAGASLLAFGGAGPLHACELATQLGATRVLCLPASGVLSAVGLAAAERRRDASRSLLQPLAEAADLDELVSELAGEGERDPRGGRPALRRAVVRAADPVRRPGRARGGVPRRARAPLRPRRPRPRRRARHPARRRRRARRRGHAEGHRRRRAQPPHDPLGRRGGRGRGADRRRPAARHHDRRPGDRRVPGDDVPRPARLVRRGRRARHPDPGGHVNAAELQVAVGSLRGIAEEMGTALIHSALSPNIKERRDCSTALFDPDGRLVIQAEHIPVHLGALPASVAAVREKDVEPGEVWVLNDPFLGGSHLPDITLVSPIHVEGELLGWAASRAHHADVGGMAAASMPADSTELHQEGLILPPSRLDDDLIDLIAANSRSGDERRGDLRAQLAVHRLAERRTAELVGRRGADWWRTACAEVWDYAERRTRAAIAEMPDGRYTATETVEALEGDLTIRATVEIDGEEVRVDFEGTDPQHGGNLNCPLAVTTSACCFVLRVIADPDAPASGGAYAPIAVTAPEGSLVNARRPAAVVAGNVETSSRITDCLMRAFGKAVDAPAQGQGTMNNLTFGSPRFTYYETIGGGQGGSNEGPGPSAVHVAMSNTLNTPVEALETAYPLRVERYALRAGSGGDGRHPGGDGVIREMTVLEPCEMSILSDRRRHPARGANGGKPGKPGSNRLNGRKLGPKARARLEPGDTVTISTPGGGGYGRPR